MNTRAGLIPGLVQRRTGVRTASSSLPNHAIVIGLDVLGGPRPRGQDKVSA